MCLRSYLQGRLLCRMSLPTVAEVVSSAAFAEEVAPVAAPLAEVETVIAGMISLMEAGSELPFE